MLEIFFAHIRLHAFLLWRLVRLEGLQAFTYKLKGHTVVIAAVTSDLRPVKVFYTLAPGMIEDSIYVFKRQRELLKR
jgi:hypothetical protein